jgi:hypothetical protein
MASPDQGLTPATVSDHFMAAAVEELRSVVLILREIKDVMVHSMEPKTPDLRSHDEVRVKEQAQRKR